MAARKRPLVTPSAAHSSAPPTSTVQDRETQDRASSVLLHGTSNLSSAWLDRLLRVSWEMPMGEGEEAVVRALVDVAAELLPTCAVGVCFVPHGGTQTVVQRHPSLRGEPPGLDPTRLFPAYAHEMILDVPSDSSGTSLHVACDDASTLAHDGAAVAMLRRLVHLLRRGLEHARLHAGVRGEQGKVQVLTSQMVQAEKLASLGQIAAGLVHELNNPLTSIVAYTDFLMKRWTAKRNGELAAAPDAEADAADELERLRRIGESAHRLMRFTRDLVSYARPSSERPVPVGLHGVIDRALAFCEHVLAEHGARVERRYADGILPVRGLPEQLTQVFVNLVTNACHAMSEGGTLTVMTELVPGEQRVRVVVADTGHGIPRETQKMIFTPFFTTKVDGRGTGLGLSIVKSIVEGHQGEIFVESEPPNGTSFIVLLPAVGS